MNVIYSDVVDVTFKSVSIFVPEFVELNVVKTDGIIPALLVNMNILEVTQSPAFAFLDTDYTIEYVIKMDPAPYVFTTGAWVPTVPWVTPIFTITRSYAVGEILTTEMSGQIVTEFERHTLDSAETETYTNSDWAAGAIEYTCAPWSRALASGLPVDVSFTVENSGQSEMSATLEATCEYAPCENHIARN